MAQASKIIKVGEWLPDLPQNDNPGVNTAENVLPLTRSSYSPVPSFLRGTATPLPSAPLGAFAAKDNGNNPAVYTGTSTDLFIQDNGTKPNFKKVSSTPGAYSVPTDGSWSFDIFNGAVYASNGTDPIQSAPVANDSVNFSTVDTNAPKAAVIAAIQPGFLLCGNINDVTVGIKPGAVRWSSLGNAGSGGWPLIGSSAAIANESDWQDVSGNNGVLKAIAPNLATCNAALFFENAVFRMIYTGDDKIFDIQPVEKLRGTPAARSVVQVGQISYYLGYDGFYAFDGTISLPIGAGKVNLFFARDCDFNHIKNVHGVGDPLNGLIYWAYAGVGNSNGGPNRVIVFNTILQRWSIITGFIGSNPLIGLTFGTSLDGIDALGFNLDNLPFSLDSDILTGGNQVLAAFDDSFYFGYFTGPNLAYQVETSEGQPITGRKCRINSVRPLVEGDSPLIAMGTRDALSVPTVYGPAAAAGRDGTAPARAEGRYTRAMLKGASGNVATHITGIEVTVSQAGTR